MSAHASSGGGGGGGTQTFERLQAEGQVLDTMAYNAALGACEAGGRWERALELYAEMQGSGTPGVAPNVLTYDVVTAVCHAAGQNRRAAHVLKDMQQTRRGAGTPPSSSSSNSTSSNSGSSGTQ